MQFSKQSQIKLKKRRKKASSNRKKVITKLDDAIRNILKQGEDRCVCCNKKNLGWFSAKENPYGLQVGHYVSRSVYALRWDLRNCHPQCSGCNYQHNHDPIPYTRFMLDTYGKEILDELTFKRREVTRFSTKQLEEMLVELER